MYQILRYFSYYTFSYALASSNFVGKEIRKYFHQDAAKTHMKFHSFIFGALELDLEFYSPVSTVKVKLSWSHFSCAGFII